MEPFIGQIKLFPYGFVPMYWAYCDGSTLQIAQNQALYSLIGTRFGGNGTTTFNLPDLRGAEPQNGSSYCIALQGDYPPRS